jgi:hypothetical protein
MKKFIIIFILVIVGLGAYFTFGKYSDGAVAGTLIKLSKKGVFFKTYEGELNQGMIMDSDAGSAVGAQSNVWPFSVKKDTALINQMEKAMLNGHRVKLHYHQRYFKLFFIGDTEYIVQSMEVLD